MTHTVCHSAYNSEARYVTHGYAAEAANLSSDLKSDCAVSEESDSFHSGKKYD